MVTYKLYYFPIRGRAEVIRLIFAHAGVDYEDIRFPMTEWPQHKSSMPLGMMPVLEVDGVKLPQSGAITRYLAKKFNLAGKTDMDAYWADVFLEALDDVGKKYPPASAGDKREELINEFISKVAPEGMQTIEKLYKEHNKCKDGYLTGENLTYADLAFITYTDFLLPRNADIFAATPGLQGVYERVTALPKIKSWIEKRPKSEY